MPDIKEQDLGLVTSLLDTDKIRIVTPTKNLLITVKAFEDARGYTALQTKADELQTQSTQLQTQVVELQTQLGTLQTKADDLTRRALLVETV